MRQTLRVTPETRYATTTDGVRIAYQVFGEGRRTLVLCLGMISCVDYQWDVPDIRDALERMARFARVVVFDRRGAGSSDRFSGGDVPPLELGVEDVGAVLAETGDQEVCLWGHYDGALVAALYAATHPEQVRALVLHCPEPYARQSPDWPWAWNEEEWAANVGAIAEGWGTVDAHPGDASVGGAVADAYDSATRPHGPLFPTSGKPAGDGRPPAGGA